MCKKDRITSFSASGQFEVEDGEMKVSLPLTKRSVEQVSKTNRYLMKVHQFHYLLSDKEDVLGADGVPEITSSTGTDDVLELHVGYHQPYSTKCDTKSVGGGLHDDPVMMSKSNTLIGIIFDYDAEIMAHNNFSNTEFVVENVFEEDMTVTVKLLSFDSLRHTMAGSKFHHEAKADFCITMSFEPLD
jgi:hypothetical protein